MNDRQVDLTDLILNDIGGTVVEVGKDERRYFLGFVETPDKGEMMVTVIGKEITNFYKHEAIRKPREQLKIDLITFTNNTESIVIKFNITNEWWMYAKSR